MTELGRPCRLSLILMSTLGVTACDGGAYTLYRSGVYVPAAEVLRPGLKSEVEALRVHVATFDAGEGEEYNRENCQTAQQLFQSQPGVTVRYWCEKGRFRR